MAKAKDFGVQSYCFRSIKDNKDVAKAVKEIGLDKIEICAVHADFSDLEGWKKIVKIYESEGVSIVSIGVQTFTGEDVERTWFECAKAAGAKHISAHFKVDSFTTAVPKVVALSKEFDIKVGIHSHGGYMFGGSPDVLEHLISLGEGRIGLNIDTAWCMQIGPARGNPIEWVKQFKDSLFGVHYKDFTFEPNGQWNDVIVGTGTLDLPAFVKSLEAINFDGMAVIEYEGDVDNPIPSLKACVTKMRELA
jgi:sugar phosphate isomerase/epimerase